VHPRKRAGGHPSRAAVAGSLVRSTREHRAGRPRTLAQAARPGEREALLTLLRVGFTEPPQSPAALVVSYTTVSPLPTARYLAGPEAVCFLWHCPAGHPGSALPTTLPCGARTFLSMASWAKPRPPGRLVRRCTRIFPPSIRLPRAAPLAACGRSRGSPGHQGSARPRGGASRTADTGGRTLGPADRHRKASTTWSSRPFQQLAAGSGHDRSS
jgi:hypothetical protein